MRKSTSAAPARLRVERAQQLDSDDGGVEVAAVRAEVHAGQRDLLEAGRRDALDLAQHVVERHASRPPARRRDDAVGARLGAAGLHAQRERRAAGDARLDRRAAAAVAVAEPLGGRQTSGVAATAVEIDSSRGLSSFGTTRTTFGKRGDFVRPPRRVAAGDDDRARRDCRARCAGSSAARPDRRVAVTEQVFTTTRSASSRRRPATRRARAAPPRSRASRPD